MSLVEKHEQYFLNSPVADFTMRWALRPLMILRAGGKKSQFFDWKLMEKPQSFSNGLIIPGDPTAFETKSTWDEMRMSLGGWENGRLVGPDYSQISAEELVDGVYYGYRDHSHKINRDTERGGKKFLNICYLVLRSQFVVLVGPGDLEVYGLIPGNMREVPMRTYSNLMPRHITIV